VTFGVVLAFAGLLVAHREEAVTFSVVLAFAGLLVAHQAVQVAFGVVGLVGLLVWSGHGALPW
jgi:hypothetical protein